MCGLTLLSRARGGDGRRREAGDNTALARLAMSDSDEDVRRFGGARTHTRQMDREGREGKEGEGGLWEGGGGGRWETHSVRAQRRRAV